MDRPRRLDQEVPSQASAIARTGGLGLEKAAGTANAYDIRRYATNKVTRFSLRAGDQVTEVFAENRLLVARQAGGKWTLHLLEIPAGGGQLVDRPVTGVADDFSGLVYHATSDEREPRSGTSRPTAASPGAPCCSTSPPPH